MIMAISMKTERKNISTVAKSHVALSNPLYGSMPPDHQHLLLLDCTFGLHYPLTHLHPVSRDYFYPFFPNTVSTHACESPFHPFNILSHYSTDLYENTIYFEFT